MSRAFSPYRIGDWTLPQRFVMAPMTRNRAGEGAAPTDLAAEYYAQRAAAGLIITEGTQPSAVGQGYPFTPGLHSAEQVTAWRKVTDAVHAGGGIFAQLMHSGRIGHPDTDGLDPVAPSAVRRPGRCSPPRAGRHVDPPRAGDRRGPASSPTSSTPPATRSRPASTGSSSTRPTAT